MYEIMRLSGQEYVDQYATRAKDESKRLEREAKDADAARIAADAADAVADEKQAS